MPRHKRISLLYITVSNVLPRNTSLVDVRYVMSKRIASLPDATQYQQQLVNAGCHVQRASCPFDQQVWFTMLQGYVPSDPCYPAQVLIAGMQHGQYVRYEGDRSVSTRRNNHTDARNNREALVELIVQELRLGRMIGPYSKDGVPFSVIKVSPLNIVPKKDKWRLINDLSSPAHVSVNDGIMHMPTKWQLIDDALQLVVDRGRGCHLAKMDVKSAYRQIPIHPDDWCLFAVEVEQLIFIDTFCPFGGRSSGHIWERYAQAMQWMLEHKYNVPSTARWVDDFFFVMDAHDSDTIVSRAQRAFVHMGVPMDDNKLEGPAVELVYVGYLINTQHMTVGVPANKREALAALLSDGLATRKVTMEWLEKLVGKLEFASKAIRLGRSYLYELRRVQFRQSLGDAQRWHKLKLSAGAKAELRWWQQAIAVDTRASIYCDLRWHDTCDVLHPSSDASEWGCGAYFDGKYISVEWSSTVKQLAGIGTRSRNMPLCEAIGVAVAINTWKRRFHDKRVLFHTDCMAVMYGINKGHASSAASPWLNAVYTFINDVCIQHNIMLRCVHIKGIDNTMSDLVSRGKVHEFLQDMQEQRMTVSCSQPRPITIQPLSVSHKVCFPER